MVAFIMDRPEFNRTYWKMTIHVFMVIIIVTVVLVLSMLVSFAFYKIR